MADNESGQNDTNSAGESQAAGATGETGDTLLTQPGTVEGDAEESGSKQADNEGEGESKDGEGTEASAEVPEKYEFKMPDGVDLDTTTAEAAEVVFKELGLSQDQADKLVALVAESRISDVNAQAEAFNKQLSDWATELKQDQEVGGEAFEENAGVARGAIEAFGSPELKEMLETTGFGNNPLMFKFALNVGKHLIEDKPGSGERAMMESSAEARLYPNEARN